MWRAARPGFGLTEFSAVRAYNPVLDRHRAAGDQAAIARLQKISPVAWQNILFLGRYLFRSPRQHIDVDALIATAILP